ncbi:hypothetical protein DFJ58DRAFT_725252 [Suillus subalutaceus]|uniref:uncharacterized protein n=1 Tax=Suillus subalutaceus TaxID=48586 RepID=UPI001B862F87|nr:uncharacterized protein DFJ58DRAFT_725252 [Suillus subalutaceus]KAG1862768.1 hypothetical protein DFJ58DRAFT_725252 [Suillus subalutaceus]
MASDAIKDKKKNQLDCIDTDSLVLWQVKINMNDLHLLNTIGDQVKGGVRLNLMVQLSKLLEFGGAGVTMIEDATNIVVRLNTEFKNVLDLGTIGPNPSTAAKSTQYREIQARSGFTKIYDGRCTEHNPADMHVLPIELFNPAFTYFSSKAFNPTYDVPEETLLSVQELMCRFATIHSNEHA